MTSQLGNPREIVVACENQETLARRRAMYAKRFPLAEMIEEEIIGDDGSSVEGAEEKKVKNDE